MTATRRAGPAPPEVRSYLLDKGADPSFSYLDIWREEHLAAFTIAKAMEADLLGDMKAAVELALEEGLPFKQFQKLLQPILADKGWRGRDTRVDPITGEEKQVQLGSPRRLKIIYDTNLRVARAAGQWQRIEAGRGVTPLLRYRLGPAEKHRPDHEALDGLVFPIDHPFWTSNYPPGGYGCKCWVESLTERRGGGDVARSQAAYEKFPPPREFKNARTGRTVKVPFGVDPGFDYNPGKKRLEGLRKAGL